MKERLNKVFTVSAMSAIALTVALSSGCKFTGGGSIQSAADEDAKATIAFNGTCKEYGEGEDISQVMTLDLQYNDHGVIYTMPSDGKEVHGLRFNVNSEIDLADLDPPITWYDGNDEIVIDSCETLATWYTENPSIPVPPQLVGVMAGEYCMQPWGKWKTEDDDERCGYLQLLAIDGDPLGQDDGVAIEIFSGFADQYFNSGTLQGNLVAH